MKTTEKVSHGYLICLPPNYDEDSKEWPLVVYLHGGGAREVDVQSSILPFMNRPFILLAPLCPPATSPEEAVHQSWDPRILGMIVRKVIDEYRIDSTMCALAGFSMGGSAAWELPYYHPDLFRKVAVISGSCHFWKLRFYPSIPIWSFSGASEEWLQQHKHTVDTARSFGIDVAHTIWPRLTHGECRDRTLSYPPFMEWLLHDAPAPRPLPPEEG
ncbi:alpha/beta hydrolase-fold protein [Candidatus Bipolaricaulota bacterium]